MGMAQRGIAQDISPPLHEQNLHGLSFGTFSPFLYTFPSSSVQPVV